MSIFKRDEPEPAPTAMPEPEPIEVHEPPMFPVEIEAEPEEPGTPAPVAATKHSTFEEYVAANDVDAPTAAAVKAYHGWGSGKRLCDADFAAAVHKVNNIPFGETPYEAPSDEPPVKD
jgi:hypothetical protein